SRRTRMKEAAPAGGSCRRRRCHHFRGYQAEPLSLVSSTSRLARLSAPEPSPDSVLWTAFQKSLETSLYFTLVGAEGRGTAFRKTSVQRGMIGALAATSASS